MSLTVQVTKAAPDMFQVEVTEGGSTTTHKVTAYDSQVKQYGGGVAAEILIRESFHFLLEREPKESILKKFDLPAIEQYFPEFPSEIRRRLS